MNLHTLNPWAILAAAASAFVLGGLWYSPFAFGTAWKKANRFESDPPAARRKVFVIAFALSLVMAFNLAMFLNDPKTNLAGGQPLVSWPDSAGSLSASWRCLSGGRCHMSW
jgi:hypothetical protein